METTQVSTSVFLRTNDNTKRNGDIRRFWRGEEEEERERQGNEVGGVAGGALYYAKHVFTRWIYGRPLRLPRLFPFLSLAESLFGFLLLVSRPWKTKIIPSCGNGKINRNANSSDAYGCVGEDYPRGGWGQVSRVRNRPWEWISMKPPSFFARFLFGRRYWKSAPFRPLKLGRKGDAPGLPPGRVIYVIWRWIRWGIVFEERRLLDEITKWEQGIPSQGLRNMNTRSQRRERFRLKF